MQHQGFSSAPVPPRPGPPAAAAPLRAYFGSGPRPGTTPDGTYLVVPVPLAEAMPLPWQQQFVSALAELHRVTASAPWPVYRVTPSAQMPIAAASEEQLVEHHITAEINDAGDLVHRNAAGVTVDPAQPVLVAVPDPLFRTQ